MYMKFHFKDGKMMKLVCKRNEELNIDINLVTQGLVF